MSDNSRDPMIEMFVFEMEQLIGQLEQLILESEREGGLREHINEVFRIMHTLKGSSAMMQYHGITDLAHKMEDVFFFIRENGSTGTDYYKLTDIVLESIDFFKTEALKISNGNLPDANAAKLIEQLEFILVELKNNDYVRAEDKIDISNSESLYSQNQLGDNEYKVTIHFDEGCEMENIRAFSIVHGLKEIAKEISHIPEKLTDNEESALIIRNNGFVINLKADVEVEELRAILEETIFLKELSIEAGPCGENPYGDNSTGDNPVGESIKTYEQSPMQIVSNSNKSFINVSVERMDMLMDLIGELVIAEAMVTQNSDLHGLQLDNFHKSAHHLRKISSEIQSVVMSIRMIPLSPTFQRMNRIVRDMCRKLSKEVELAISGADTEVDKNIIESISDPLMHIIRNAIDHGIETCEERIIMGKPKKGVILLDAKSSGGDVIVTIRDDGKGIDKNAILKKALEKQLIKKKEEDLTEQEIYSFILLPGFSTKEKITEYSGRGVGLDVVAKGIEKMGGSMSIESEMGKGTTVTIKIPLTLAIMDGMIVRVGNSRYIIPTASIRESFRIQDKDIVRDMEDNEMIMVRGDCIPVLKLHNHFQIETDVTNMPDGIVVLAESNHRAVCIFADALVGQQQIVVKSLPGYIKRIKGVAGCTLLGDGGISLIMDIGSLIC